MTLAELRERCASLVEGFEVECNICCHSSPLSKLFADKIRAIPLPKEKDPQELVEAIRDALESLQDGFPDAAKQDLHNALLKWELENV